MKNLAKIFCVVIFCGFMLTGKAEAADLSSASATLSTSRPSPSSPLSANAVSSDGQLTILNNGSRYLASDSAKLIQGNTGQILSNNVPVASQSGTLTSVFLSGTVGSAGGAGSDVLYVPITAMHTIRFVVATSIPTSGTIVINYAGTGDNAASPSASTFAFNGLSSGNVQANFSTGSSTCSFTVNAPNITCTVGTATVTAGTIVTILVGCSTQSGGTCTTQVPTLINPTKGAQAAGTADIWKIRVNTTDGVVNLDSATLAVGVIESVTVRANVDPSLTFTIAGIANGSAVNTGNNAASTCDQAELTNTGITSTATEVNLGTLTNSPSSIDTRVGNISAQLLTVTTNAANGYVLTATSSGPLRNPTTGFFLQSVLTPQAFPAGGTHFFGFHACGLDTLSTDVGTTYWNTTASDTNCNSYTTGSAGNLCKYGWPSTVVPITVASDTTGPIGNAIASGNGLTSMSYAAGADPRVPPGEYTTVVTYTATPAF